VLQGRLRLSDAERVTLGEIGHRLGRKALSEVATAALPDTILGWIKELIVRIAKENRSRGYDRIVGALANLGHEVSDQTVGNVLRRHGIPPAPERKRTTTWAEFIRAHLAVLAGTDFFTVEVLTLRGQSRKVEIAGITTHPTEQWMKQMTRNVTMEGCGALGDSRYLLHDRDTKYAASFLAIVESVHVKTLQLPAQARMNAYCER
jgi:putative transposase